MKSPANREFKGVMRTADSQRHESEAKYHSWSSPEWILHILHNVYSGLIPLLENSSSYLLVFIYIILYITQIFCCEIITHPEAANRGLHLISHTISILNHPRQL